MAPKRAVRRPNTRSREDPTPHRRNVLLRQWFSLRDTRMPYTGRTCTSTSTSHKRQRAGRKAWATRLRLYGPSGRRDGGVHRLTNTAIPRRLETAVRRTDPVVVIPVRRPTPPEVVGEVADAGTEDMLPDDRGGDDIPDGGGDTVEFADADGGDEPALPIRSPLAEVTLPLAPPPIPPAPGRPPTPEPQANPMTTLLNARRALLLGPQDLTTSARPPAPPEPGFTLHEDAAPGDEHDSDVMDDEMQEGEKENTRPEWFGAGVAPRAPGRERVDAPAVAEEAAVGGALVEGLTEDDRGGDEAVPTAEPFLRFFD